MRKKSCRALALFLLLVPLAGMAQTLRIPSLGLTVQPPEGYVVLRENTDAKSGEIRVIMEMLEVGKPQFFLRAAPLTKKEELRFSAMDEEATRSFLKQAGIAYQDARTALAPLGGGKIALEVWADQDRYYALYVVQKGFLASYAVASNAGALTADNRRELAALLQSMRWQPGSKSAEGEALQQNARLLAQHLYAALSAGETPQSTAVPTPRPQREEADLLFR